MVIKESNYDYKIKTTMQQTRGIIKVTKQPNIHRGQKYCLKQNIKQIIRINLENHKVIIEYSK